MYDASNRAMLLIKGPADDALIALNAHGFTEYTAALPIGYYQVFFVPVTPRVTLRTLQDWFGADIGTRARPGSLLHFSYQAGQHKAGRTALVCGTGRLQG